MATSADSKTSKKKTPAAATGKPEKAVKTPAKAPAKPPAKVPVKAPAKAPVKPASKPVAKKPAPAKSPAKPAKDTATAGKAPAKTPAKPAAGKTPAKPATKPASAPASKPASTPVKTPATKTPVPKAAAPEAKPATKPVLKPESRPAAAKAKEATPSPTPSVSKAVSVKTETSKPVAPKAAPKTSTAKSKPLPVSTALIHGSHPYQEEKGEEYMNPRQREHFTHILQAWKRDLMREVDRTVHHMQDESANLPDPNDRATQEEEFSLELRTRDRERKLIKKIDQTIDRIEKDDYGFCDDCGVEIGIRRLEARPTATLCIDCKSLAEIKEKQIVG